MTESNLTRLPIPVMRTLFRPLLALAALATVAGCSNDPTGPSLREIEAHEALWKAQHLSSYTFTFRQMCFCAPIITQPATVEVRNGQVANVVSSTGEPVTAEMRVMWPTIDQLFEHLKAERREGHSQLTITWNGARGYPATVSSSMPNVADAGYDLSVTGLQPAP